MARRVHTIHSTGTKPAPQSIIVLQQAVKQQYMGEADDVGHLGLSLWAAKIGTRAGGKYAWNELAYSNEPSRLWRLIDGVGRSSPHVMLVSMYAREQLAISGLWDMIAAGTATLTGADPYYREYGDTEYSRKRNGYVVLDAPPTIVCFMIPGNAAIYTWIDIANWSVGDPAKYATYGDNDDPSKLPWESAPWMDGLTLRGQVDAVRLVVDSYIACLAELGTTGIEHTAASQAQSLFRSQYMDCPIEIHDCEPVLEMERAALYGGRCEARFIGTLEACEESGKLYRTADDPRHVKYGLVSLHHLDVNSLYPAVAADAYLPTKLKGVWDNVSYTQLSAALKGTACIANVTLTIESPIVPIRWDGRIVWPVGTFTTTLCGPELQLATQTATKLTCHRLAVYERHPIYARFVTELYLKRQEYLLKGDEVMSQCVKGILNSAFGKWAQRSKAWESVPNELPPAPYSQWYRVNKQSGECESWRSLCWDVQKLVVRGETNESFPAITAYIQSLGRVRLWNLIQAAGQENVYYYDTDSLIVNNTGAVNLIALEETHNTELGKLKYKGEHQRITIYGRQAYQCDGKLVMSGLIRNATPPTDAFALMLNAPPIQHYLLKDLPPGIDRHTVRIRKNRPYEHGHVQPDGTVLPIRFVAG